MEMKTLKAFTLGIAIFASSAQAQTSNDRLCQAIGETRVTALQPRDRIFFEDNCICWDGICAIKGGKVAIAAKNAFLKRIDDERIAAEKAEELRREQLEVEKAFRKEMFKKDLAEAQENVVIAKSVYDQCRGGTEFAKGSIHQTTSTCVSEYNELRYWKMRVETLIETSK